MKAGGCGCCAWESASTFGVDLSFADFMSKTPVFFDLLLPNHFAEVETVPGYTDPSCVSFQAAPRTERCKRNRRQDRVKVTWNEPADNGGSLTSLVDPTGQQGLAVCVGNGSAAIGVRERRRVTRW